MHIYSSELKHLLIALPPHGEQQAIAAFLDHETAKIDTLITKKRLLLDRLAEYRTALITRTVTKGLPPEAARAAGLHPNPPLKPSGVEWMGEIPEALGCRNGWRIVASEGGRTEDPRPMRLDLIRCGDFHRVLAGFGVGQRRNLADRHHP